jgi:hypothetical protein
LLLLLLLLMLLRQRCQRRSARLQSGGWRLGSACGR